VEELEPRCVPSYLVTNTDDGGVGSLRYGLGQVNLGMVDQIEFDIPGDGPHTIQPGSRLPQITKSVSIIGTIAGGRPQIELDGTSAGSGSGLEFDVSDSGTSSVSGLAINRFPDEGILIDPFDQGTLEVSNCFIGTNVMGTGALGNRDDGILDETMNPAVLTVSRNVISGNANDGIEILGHDARGTIIDNKIGTDATGTQAIGNGRTGINLYNTTATIGGTTTGFGNIISGNNADGILISGGARSNLVEGNFIGTDVTGTAVLANGGNGVNLYNTTGNTVGGTATGAGNLISGNAGSGVLVSGQASNNMVQGNTIGTDRTGTAAVGNGDSGVAVVNASNNTVGGAATGTGNLISGNASTGVLITGSGTVGNVVQGNLIGTDATGTLALGNGAWGVHINMGAGAEVIGGTSPAARNVISGNAGNSVGIDGPSTGNLVEGNYIGTDVTGTAAIPNGAPVGIEGVGATNNTVGGTAVGAGNVISGSPNNGVAIFTNASGNLVQGNLIGTDASGTLALGNAFNGVFILGGAHGNTVGGAVPGARNVISGNGTGVLISDSGTTGNLVLGNFIGTDVTGTAAIGNVGPGVFINDSPNNTVGGTTAAARNVISGNLDRGVQIQLNAASGNVVQGNYIGLDANGTNALGNGTGGTGFGVRIADASNNQVGGTAPGAGNVISATSGDGLTIAVVVTTGENPVATGNLVQGNFIGTAADGASPLGNSGNGVAVLGATGNASGNTIGGTVAGSRNVIAFSGNDGVLVDTGTGNPIRGDSIHDSANLGIELANGGNNNQPFPALTSATSDGSTTTVQGTLTAAPNTTYTLEFFADTVPNPSGFGEGERPLGIMTVTTGPDGTASFTATLPAVPLGQFASATATDPGNDTSQFAQCVAVTGPSAPGAGGAGPAGAGGTSAAPLSLAAFPARAVAAGPDPATLTGEGSRSAWGRLAGAPVGAEGRADLFFASLHPGPLPLRQVRAFPTVPQALDRFWKDWAVPGALQGVGQDLFPSLGGAGAVAGTAPE
jgi:titin